MGSSSNSQRDPVERLAEEFLERRRRGEAPTIEEFQKRHPELAGPIGDLFPALLLMDRLDPAPHELADAPDTTREPAHTRMGDYRILRAIGQGGMGVVYEAEQLSLGRRVALKVLPRHRLLDGNYRMRFEREARAAAKLHHTNIVPVFGVGEHDGLPYYVMQYIQGLGLDLVLREIQRMAAGTNEEHGDDVGGGSRSVAGRVVRSLLTGRFGLERGEDHAGQNATVDYHSHDSGEENFLHATPSPQLGRSAVVLPGSSGSNDSSTPGAYWRSVAHIGQQVAEALDYAHQQGIIHRDIKPSNLLLDQRGNVWVADFELAKAQDQDDLTHTGDVLGTLRYMPPEAFEGKTDARGDIYSLGLTLYELTAHRPAFDETDRARLIKQVTASEPTRLEQLNAKIPRDLATILHKAIEREADHRYAAASDLAADLRRFLADEPIQARRVSSVERLTRWSRRNPVIASLLGLVTILLLVTTIGSMFIARRETEIARQATAATEQAARDADEQRRLIGQQFVAQGLRLLDENDQAGALLNFVEALKRDNLHEERATMHRVRLAALLNQSPRPTHIWSFPGQVLADVAYSPDGSRFAIAASKEVHVFDLETGRQVGMPLLHEKEVRKADFSASGNRLLTQELHEREPPDKRGFLSSSRKIDLNVWDLQSGRRMLAKTHVGHAIFGFQRDHELDVLLSADGKRLLCGLDHHTLQVWDVDKGALVGPELKHLEYIQIAILANDGRRVVSFDNAVMTWDLTKPGSEPRRDTIDTIPEDGLRRKLTIKRVGPIAVSPDRSVLILHDRENRGYLAWDQVAGKKRWESSTPINGLAIAVSADSARLAVKVPSITNDPYYSVLDLPSGSQLPYRLPGTRLPSEVPTSLSPDGSVLARGTELLDLSTGKQSLLAMPAESAVVQQFSPDSRYFLCGTPLGVVGLFRTSTRELAYPLLHHSRPLQGRRHAGLGFSPEGRFFHTISEGVVRVWPVTPVPQGHRPIAVVGRRSRHVLSPDGTRLVLIQEKDGQETAQLLELPTGRVFATLWQRPVLLGKFAVLPNVLSAIFSPNGSRVLTWDESGSTLREPSHAADRRIQLWDGKTGQRIAALPCPKGCMGASFDSNSRRLLIVTGDNGVQLLSAADGTLVAVLHDAEQFPRKQMYDDGPRNRAEFSPDGQRLVVVRDTYVPRKSVVDPAKGEVRVYESATGQPCGPSMPIENVSALALPIFHPDGKHLLLGEPTEVRGFDGELQRQAGRARLWNVETGKPVGAELPRVSAARFDLEGNRLITVSGWLKGGKVRIVEPNSGEELVPPLHLSEPPMYLVMSPNGKLACAPCPSGAVFLIGVAKGEVLSRLTSHTGPVTRAQFSTDGRRLLTVEDPSDLTYPARRQLKGIGDRNHGSARVWQVDSGQPLTPMYRLVDDEAAQADASLERLVLSQPIGLSRIDVQPDLRPLDELVREAQVVSLRRFNPAATMIPLEEIAAQRDWERIVAERPGFAARAPSVLAWHEQQMQGDAAGFLHSLIPMDMQWGPIEFNQRLWHLERLLALEPERSAWLERKAYVLMAQRKLLEAEQTWNRSIKLNDSPVARFVRGRIMLVKKNLPQAHEDLTKAWHGFGKSDGDRDLLLDLAVVCLTQNDLAGYRDVAQTVVSSGVLANMPTNLMEFLTLGPEAVPNLAEKLHELESRIADLKSEFVSEQMTPVLKGRMYYRLGRYADAVKELAPLAEKRVEKYSRAMPFCFLAMALQQEGETERAQQALARAKEEMAKDFMKTDFTKAFPPGTKGPPGFINPSSLAPPSQSHEALLGLEKSSSRLIRPRLEQEILLQEAEAALSQKSR